MTPVGRLVLVRSVDKRELVNAMAWVTMPALIGPLLGPPLGGFITTYFSWHWIFLINIPIGLIGIVLATLYIEDVRGEMREPFDCIGFVLAGLGIGGLAFGARPPSGMNFLPTGVVVALIAVGARLNLRLCAARAPHAARRCSISRCSASRPFAPASLGGFMFRIGVGAMPFLLPLLLQLGFDMTPFQSGLITFSTAVGAMGMKAVDPDRCCAASASAAC